MSLSFAVPASGETTELVLLALKGICVAIAFASVCGILIGAALHIKWTFEDARKDVSNKLGGSR